VPPPSAIPAPARRVSPRAPLAGGAQLALTTVVLASTVSFAVHAFGIPHAMHTGKAVGPSFFYLALTVLWTLLRRRRRLTGVRLWGLAVFAGGSLANLAEALLTGGVTDFVPLHAGALTMRFSAGDLAVLAGTAASFAAFLQRSRP
jgi:lipoprotein signal peptidase